MNKPAPLSEISNFPIWMAPMVGLSHVATRMLIRRYTPASAKTIWPTEMLNSRRMKNADALESMFLARHEGETGFVPQILGNEQKPIETSVRLLKAWGAVGIDINMGCPVKKALRHNYGVALMGDGQYAADVVRMTVEASELPVSVKLRAGEQNNIDFLLNFADGLVQAGVSWLTLHPRTPQQKRRGTADWRQIKILKESVNVDVIGNGDVQTSQDVFNMLTETGCDAVMVGRALCARPWLMWQVAERLGYEAPIAGRRFAPKTPVEEGAEYGDALLYLISQFRSFFEEPLGLRRLNFYLRHTSAWLTFGHDLETRLSRVKSYLEAESVVTDFFSRPQHMMQKTQLRM